MEKIQEMVKVIKEQLDIITSQSWSRGYDLGYRAGEQSERERQAGEAKKPVETKDYKSCPVCDGQGWYPDGPTDKPIQVACVNCCGKGILPSETPPQGKDEPVPTLKCPYSVITKDGEQGCGWHCPTGADADCNISDGNKTVRMEGNVRITEYR